MSVNLLVSDGQLSGTSVPAFEMSIEEDFITVRELIRRRVLSEVQSYNTKAEEVMFHGLVQPGPDEQLLNSGSGQGRKKRLVDGEAQVKAAIEAFQRNGFFILIDDRQVESLDDEIDVHRVKEATFVRLVPLVGG